jgi:hypothetical protein
MSNFVMKHLGVSLPSEGSNCATDDLRKSARNMAQSPRKSALITGATGQDGAYMAGLLLSKGYVVHGIKRHFSSYNTTRVDHLYHNALEYEVQFHLHCGDMTDATNLIRIVQETQPDEIYNLAAQSHVQVSFDTPEYTANANAIGTLRLLEAIRILGREKLTRFFQASTSELYGKVREVPERRRRLFILARPMRPRSCTRIGLPSTTAKPTECTRQMGFCSITRVQFVAKPSSREKLLVGLPPSNLGFRRNYFLAT